MFTEDDDPEIINDYLWAEIKEHSTPMEWAALHLPGMNEYVRHPIDKDTCMLYDAVNDLLTRTGWDLGRVADWLDTLDFDMTFKGTCYTLPEMMRGVSSFRDLGSVVLFAEKHGIIREP